MDRAHYAQDHPQRGAQQQRSARGHSAIMCRNANVHVNHFTLEMVLPLKLSNLVG